MWIGMRRWIMLVVKCVLLVNNEKKDTDASNGGGRGRVIVLNMVS